MSHAGAEVILSWVALLDSTFDFRPIVTEWAREAQHELDFTHEAAVMAEVRINMQRYGLPSPSHNSST